MFIETRHLATLRAIKETGSFSKAAEKMHLTQSALSHQIKSIEHYFSVDVLNRNAKGITFTPSGEQLLELAEYVLPKIAATETLLNRVSLGEVGRLHIAIECHACFEWLMPVLEEFKEHWPEVEVDIRLGLSFQSLAALKQGDVDLVISSDPTTKSDLSFLPLFDYESLLVLHHQDPLSKKSYIQAKDLAGVTLITYPVKTERMDVFQNFLNPAHVHPKEIRQVESTKVILLLVASGRGVAALPNWVVAESLNHSKLFTKSLGKQGLHKTLYAAVRHNQQDLDYVKAFIRLAANAGNNIVRK
ncbi:MAG: LysR family transcriptional regulator [Pseudomonadota bacterium]